MTLRDLITGCQPVKPEHQVIFKPYLDGRFSSGRTKPMFFTSPMWWGMKSVHLWRILDGCLCILKKQFLYNPSIQLLGPPMSPTGDLENEKKVLEKLRHLGVSCRMTDEDKILLGYEEGSFVQDEFLYLSDTFSQPPAGKTGQHWRWSINRSQNLGFNIREWIGPAPDEAIKKCYSISEQWQAKKLESDVKHSGKHAPYIKLLMIYNEFAAKSPWPCRLMLIEDKAGEPLAFTLWQSLPRTCILLMGYHVVDHPSWGAIDIARLTHYLDCNAVSRTAGLGVICNVGGGSSSKGMFDAKNKLLPMGMVGIYNIRPHVQLTKEAYQESGHMQTESSNSDNVLDLFDDAPKEPPAISMESMTMDNLLDVMVIEKECFPGTGFSKRFFTKLLVDNQMRTFIIRVGTQIAGYFMYKLPGPRAKRCHLYSIAVSPMFRRKGLSKIMMDKLLVDARQDKAIKISLAVEIDNLSAKTLYEAYGFRITGRKEGCYQNGAAADLMELSLA